MLAACQHHTSSHDTSAATLTLNVWDKHAIKKEISVKNTSFFGKEATI